jgi:TPR repeat protein
MRTATILLVCLLPALACADYEAGLRSYRAKDYVAAFSEWLPLAAQGDVKAEYAIGSLFASGLGVKKDYPEAAKWFRKAAEQGYAAAQNALGSAHQFGRGVPRDEVEATRWYQKAADQGFIGGPEQPWIPLSQR